MSPHDAIMALAATALAVFAFWWHRRAVRIARDSATEIIGDQRIGDQGKALFQSLLVDRYNESGYLIFGLASLVRGHPASDMEVIYHGGGATKRIDLSPHALDGHPLADAPLGQGATVDFTAAVAEAETRGRVAYATRYPRRDEAGRISVGTYKGDVFELGPEEVVTLGHDPETHRVIAWVALDITNEANAERAAREARAEADRLRRDAEARAARTAANLRLADETLRAVGDAAAFHSRQRLIGSDLASDLSHETRADATG